MILNKPDPMQPTDTTDTVIGMQVSMNGFWLDHVEFECSQCHTRYWRGIDSKESFTEVVEVEGVGTYAVNPTVEFFYAPNPHHCVSCHPHTDALYYR